MTTVSIKWDDRERTILLQILEEDWTWEDLAASFAQMRDMLVGVEHRVDIIIDVSRCEGLPIHVGARLPELRGIPIMTHPTFGLSVAVGANSLYQTIMSVLEQLFSRTNGKLVFHETLEEARAFIAERRAADS